MKSFLLYTSTWLLLPWLAFRHKFIGVSEYQVRTESLKLISAPNYIVAKSYFDLILELDQYGSFCELVEILKSGKESRIAIIRW